MQSPTCLLKTRRLADNHGRCFVSRRWRCSHLQPPWTCITDSASTRSTGALPELHCYQPYTICVISLANGAGKYDVGENNNSARGGDVGTRFFSKTRESGAWEHSCILLSAAAVVTTSAVVSQRKTMYPCRFVTNPDPELFLESVIFVCL